MGFRYLGIPRRQVFVARVLVETDANRDRLTCLHHNAIVLFVLSFLWAQALYNCAQTGYAFPPNL